MSLRKSLIIAFSILLTLIGALAAYFAYESARREAWDIMDLQQRQIARFIDSGSAILNSDAYLPSHNSDEDYVFEIRDKVGNLIRSSNPDLVFPEDSRSGFSEFSDISGTWRLFSVTRADLIIKVAQKTSERDELAADAAFSSAIPFLLAIPLSWAVVYVLVGLVFRRLEETIASVETRSLTDIEPLSLIGVPLEIKPLIEAVNSAFERIRSSVEQQQQFLSDAAHELRTPLAALSLQIGNLKNEHDDVKNNERFSQLESGVRRASRVTSQLLKLARQDSQKLEPAQHIVDLQKIVLNAIENLMPLAIEKKIDLGIVSIEEAKVIGNPFDILTLIEIIAENALKYTPEGGFVDVTLNCSQNAASVQINDTGPGIPPHQLGRVFDRFYRGDTGDEPGTGLGLSIALSIATQNSATITLSNRTDVHGLEAKISFPLLV